MKWVNLIPLLIFTALVVGVIFVVRPRARRSRHAAWEKAGLLPHQVDPDSVRNDDTSDDDPTNDDN